MFAKNEKRIASGQKFNLGDLYQTFAIDELYCRMGIPADQVVDVERRQLRTYSGQPVRLPLCGMFGHVKGNEIFPMSDRITPVYLGYHANTKPYLKPACYKGAGPVGCRDESSWRAMEKAGIPAFISGCMTLTLPRRTREPENGKIFFVDAPASLEPFIPAELRPRITYLGQEIEMDTSLPNEELIRLHQQQARERLDLYVNQASLVVTSRLHCAAPCTALGIPVILARNYFDDRYTFLDKFLHPYTPDEFAGIDWHPAPVEMEKEKDLIIQMAIAMLRGEPNPDYNRAVHEMYLNRVRSHEMRYPMKTKVYYFMLDHFPKTADLMREKVLKRFSVQRDNSKG